MTDSKLHVLILAAGKGTRMRSTRAKVLHEIFFAPMIVHVLEAVAALEPASTSVVVGHQRREVMAALAGRDLEFVVQEQQNGTAHAVLAAAPELRERAGTLLILCGDTPLVTPQTLQDMLAAHRQRGDKLSVMTTRIADPFGYGRIVCDRAGRLERIVEEKDATAEQRLIKEINAGIYCAEIDFLFPALARVGNDNRQGEMYLTDIVEIAVREGLRAHSYCCADPDELLGVNSRVELARAHAHLQRRRNHELMLAGVTMYQPETIQVAPGVSIGRDSVIHPHVTISGSSRIGVGCTINSFNLLHNCDLPNGAEVAPFHRE
ncbi:bifunctional UDP-N-acetylglucosamine diphosphorylase/glucosamine-1-phosphate N-acetyltransferase GlmU [Desulfurivibrio dismutans]|uniref:bifunctional UDP-N-acetylglucosamine diphosphorylase/glucosamine-1-phosphate N-acetyltransferase GlmU n=1 Tax=Desulfurivibrio dismutans TaxID=1398908 RepID=UPI0023DC3179|nr:NTP transferase domain-containing protein [Desulfurivibrio alkaliphilus]MDF1615539.1 NTP transferase domain-containing protein [Desulfurivibrio alkaliphilus]